MPLLTVTTTDHVATLTLNRPESMNALGQAGDGDAFVAVCDAINADSNIRCAILTGAGRAFSAGGDIKAMQNRTGPPISRTAIGTISIESCARCTICACP